MTHSSNEKSEKVIRFSRDGKICLVWRDGEPVRCPTQRDMDKLPVGKDMTAREIAKIED